MKSFLILIVFTLSLSAYSQTKSVAGTYESINSSCPGGFTACDLVTISKLSTGVLIASFGVNKKSPYTAKLKSVGANQYSFEASFNDDCQSPGCGNMLSISGKVYLEKGKSVVLANFVTEFSNPEEPGDRQGTFSTTIKFFIANAKL